jgi:hypothetical protein
MSLDGGSRLGWRAMLACALLVCAACAQDECVERKQDNESCGLRYQNVNICDTAHGECAIECDHRAGCAVLRAALDGDEPPESYLRCVTQCVEPFRCDDGETTINARWRCDGQADCRDRADESGCHYYECGDGQRVRESARCDDYDHCSDGSDEEGC